MEATISGTILISAKMKKEIQIGQALRSSMKSTGSTGMVALKRKMLGKPAIVATRQTIATISKMRVPNEIAKRKLRQG